jgi:hypothetical protein
MFARVGEMMSAHVERPAILTKVWDFILSGFPRGIPSAGKVCDFILNSAPTIRVEIREIVIKSSELYCPNTPAKRHWQLP